MLFITLVAGCASTKPPAAPGVVIKETITVIDTVIIRDTILQAPAASATLNADLKDLKEGFKQQSKSNQATASASVAGGKLSVNCDCDSLSIYAKLHDRYSMVQSDRQETITPPPVIQYDKYVPWWVRFLAWFGGIALVVVAGAFILYRLKIIK